MHAVKGEITAKGMNALEVVRVELQETSRKFSLRYSHQVNLWGSHDEYTEEYPRNQDTQASFLDESSNVAIPQGVIHRRSRDDEKERHYPVFEEFCMNGRRKTGYGILNGPWVEIKKAVAMVEEYG